METRTVWVVNYFDRYGTMRKAEYFCETAQKARQMFRNKFKASAGYRVVNILDWREDLRKERQINRIRKAN